jgi:hypothetical protein
MPGRRAVLARRLAIEREVIHVAALRARHVSSGADRPREQPFDAARAGDRRRAAVDDLAVPVVLGAADPELDLIAFLADGRRIAVDLVEQHDAARHAAEPAGRVRADQRSSPPGTACAGWNCRRAGSGNSSASTGQSRIIGAISSLL